MNEYSKKLDSFIFKNIENKKNIKILDEKNKNVTVSKQEIVEEDNSEEKTGWWS